MNDTPDQTPGEAPVFARSAAPDHRPGFWADLEREMTGATTIMPVPQATTELTSTVPTSSRLPTAEIAAAPAQSAEKKAPMRRLWPLVAAAATLAIVGLGLLFARGNGGPTDQVVSGADDAQTAASESLDGQGDGTGDVGELPPPIPTAIPTAVSVPDAATADEAVAAPTPAPESPAQPQGEVPTYEMAFGNTATVAFLPGTPLVDGSRWLETSIDRQVSWFSVPTGSDDCNDPGYAHIVYANDAGLVLAGGDPDLGFSGEVSHFTVSADGTRAAWIVTCDEQLEFYVASLGDPANPGRLTDIDLAWVGHGVDRASDVTFAGEAVLNTVALSGRPSFVSVNVDQRSVEGSGLDEIVASAPFNLDRWIIGATADGRSTYWAANPVTSEDQLVCNGTNKPNRTLWHRSATGDWTPAVVDDSFVDDLGAPTHFAIEPEFSQVAFADFCPGVNTGRFYLGQLRADGLIATVRTIDISAFASGQVKLLEWVDPITLRIHTDETITAGTELRFEYLFDDGREAGVLVQLN